MTNKELAIRALPALPEDVSLERIVEEIAILELIRKGEEAADAGDVTPHDEFEREVKGWHSK